ncbi:PEGA domain-containing protein [Candidatus Roizmanbacteria bacterium]|nr:PEGA domain-containing protein [Candidatus Roizmanbacteria bacterium]
MATNNQKTKKPYTKIAFQIIVAVLFVFVLVSIIGFARGYRLDLTRKSVTPTGILAVSAFPKAAKVYVNGTMKGVSDLNLTLPPGDYTVSIKKEGYTDWNKKITLKGEVVIGLDAVLFPRNASLSPMTNLGVVKAIPIGQIDKLLLFAQNNDPLKDGIYVFESNQQPIALFPPLKLILLKKNLPEGVDLKKTQVTFSPNDDQAIMDFYAGDKTYSYLVYLNQENTDLVDFSQSPESKANFLAKWSDKHQQDIAKVLETFPKDIKKVATDSFHIIGFSEDDRKVLYTAENDAILPPVITPPLIGANQTAESRTLQSGHLYVYDKKEDKNFEITSLKLPLTPTPTPTITPTPYYTRITPTPTEEKQRSLYPITWYADSKHLVQLMENEIVIVDYDGSNKQTVYSGPFRENFFMVSSQGRLFILTNLNPQNNPFDDVYEVGIR